MSGFTLMDQSDLFVSGEGGYHTYRIPALAVTIQGTLLAFCEGRKYGRGDAGEIHLLLKRSVDNGASWSDTQVILAEQDMTCGNPCPVVDPYDGAIWLPFCKNLGEGHEALIKEGKAPRTVWVMHSRDDGATWAEPAEITADVKRPEWTWYATGPCHGIAHSSGRLLLPCDHVRGVNFDKSDPRHSHIVYSDDHGASWQIGGIVDEGTNECAVEELTAGEVYLNCRSYRGRHRRVIARSADAGLTFAPSVEDDTLVEPVCQAALARYDAQCVLFSNPASTNREKLTLRASYDDCHTWPDAWLLHAGPAAYSDLAVLSDRTVCCLYERGDEHPYGTIALARVRLQ